MIKLIIFVSMLATSLFSSENVINDPEYNQYEFIILLFSFIMFFVVYKDKTHRKVLLNVYKLILHFIRKRKINFKLFKEHLKIIFKDFLFNIVYFLGFISGMYIFLKFLSLNHPFEFYIIQLFVILIVLILINIILNCIYISTKRFSKSLMYQKLKLVISEFKKNIKKEQNE